MNVRVILARADLHYIVAGVRAGDEGDVVGLCAGAGPGELDRLALNVGDGRVREWPSVTGEDGRTWVISGVLTVKSARAPWMARDEKRATERGVEYIVGDDWNEWSRELRRVKRDWGSRGERARRG